VVFFGPPFIWYVGQVAKLLCVGLSCKRGAIQVSSPFNLSLSPRHTIRLQRYPRIMYYRRSWAAQFLACALESSRADKAAVHSLRRMTTKLYDRVERPNRAGQTREADS
jgi:hypothetical protein